jgi:hypothetical protein
MSDIVKRLRVPDEEWMPKGTRVILMYNSALYEPDNFSLWYGSGIKLEAADEIERLRARVAVLEGLLSPLSAEADRYDPPEGDDDHLAWGSVLTIGHLRKTRAALEAKP